MQHQVITPPSVPQLTQEQRDCLETIYKAICRQNPYESLLDMYSFDEPAKELYQPCNRCGEQPSDCLCRGREDQSIS